MAFAQIDDGLLPSVLITITKKRTRQLVVTWADPGSSEVAKIYLDLGRLLKFLQTTTTALKLETPTDGPSVTGGILLLLSLLAGRQITISVAQIL